MSSKCGDEVSVRRGFSKRDVSSPAYGISGPTACLNFSESSVFRESAPPHCPRVHLSWILEFHVTQNTVTFPRCQVLVIASRHRHPVLRFLPSIPPYPRVPPFFLALYTVSFYLHSLSMPLLSTSKRLRADLYDRFLLSSSTPRPLFTTPLWK